MPSGPFNNFEINGPLTESSTLHGSVLFTNNVTSENRVTVPKAVRESHDIEPGDRLIVTIYPLKNSTLNMRKFETTEVNLERSRNRFMIPDFVVNRLHLLVGETVLVVVQNA